MKKFIIGFVCGAMLFSGAAVSADAIKNVIIGKKIDGVATVIIDGKTLDKNAITVEGMSYVPVRAMVEAVGKEISSVKNGKIEVITKVEDETKRQLKFTLDKKKMYLENRRKDLAVVQERLANGEDERGTKFENGILESVRIPWEQTEAYARFSAEAAEYERQIAQLEAEIAELEAQLAALE